MAAFAGAVDAEATVYAADYVDKKPKLLVVLINLLVVAVLWVQVTPAPACPLAGPPVAYNVSAQEETKVPVVLVK